MAHMSCWLCGFTTTEFVTDAKTLICKNGYCQSCIAVANVDEEIKQAVATLHRLLAKRCDLRSEQNRAHDHIRRLPVELRNHIFELVLPRRDEWGKVRAGRVDQSVRPSYLTSICRGWRDMALSNPFLWSTVRAVLGSSKPSQFNLLPEWILRSGSSPLTLDIDVRRDQDRLEEELEWISQSSDRWHSLSLFAPSESLRVFHHSDLQLYRIKRLRIVALCGRHDQPLPFLNTTIRPEQIEIRDVSFRSLPISWSHVTSVIVRDFDLGEITQLFQAASQMTYCRLWQTTRWTTQDLLYSPVTHTRLKTLCLDMAPIRVTTGAALLGSLTLPRLQEFHTILPHLAHLAHLPALIHRSSCPLTSIVLLDGPASALEPLHGLQPLHGVTDLVLEEMVTDLVHRIPQKFFVGYWPDLRNLTLHPATFFLLWEKGIVPTLLHPSPGIPILHKIRVVFEGLLDEFVSKLARQYLGLDMREMEADLRLLSTLEEDGFLVFIPEV